MPYDSGLTYDSTGGFPSSGAGSKFGEKWKSGGLAGLSGAGTSSPVYSRGPRKTIAFTGSGTVNEFDAKYFTLQKLTYVPGSSSSSSSSEEHGDSYFRLLDPSGMIRTFDANGRIESVSGKCGNHTTYHYNSGTGKIEEVSTTFDNGTNRYVYAWAGDKIASVTFWVGTRAVLKSVYGYAGDQLTTIKLYENTTTFSNPTDWGAPISSSLYTYHEDSGLLRHVIPPTLYRQMVNNGIDPESLTLSDPVLNQYASAEYEYVNGRVSRMYKHGRRYTHDFEYAFNYPTGSDLNQWTTRTTETLSDGTKHVYYFNRIGQWMLHKVIESPEAGTKVWYPLYQKFDATNGRLILSANDSAIASVNETHSWLVTLETNKGLISESAYNASGRLESTGIRNGTSSPLIGQRAWTYEARNVVGKGTIYVPKTQKVYRTEDPASAITTSFDYLWYDDSFQYSKRTTNLPVIDADQNGRGESLTTESHFNPRGLLVESVDQRGTVTKYTYDEARGGLTSRIEDFGTGRENLITDYLLDDRGRTIRTLGPVHEVAIDGTPTAIRTASWTYFQDSQDSRLSFSGYQTASGTPSDNLVGPVIIEKSNIAPTPGSSYLGWRQSTTIAAAYDGIGIPTPSASFDQSTWLRWSLALYDNASELKEQRTYFNIPSTTNDYGVRSVNYARTLYSYDTLGRQNQTTDPDDTVDQTTYNAMSWVTKSETGTVLGALLTTALNEYDDDGNLLKITLPVSGSDRVTDFLYDWRNRRTEQSTVVEKDGSGTWTLITKYTYNNLNQTTEVTGYHTSVSIGNRTSHQTTEYDDLGRTFRTTVRGVDPTNGNLTGSLISNLYYNQTGQVARSAPAGSQLFTTTTYDRIGRSILVSQAYESSSSSSSSSSGAIGPDPADLSNAIVMSQQEMFWDQAGNLISSTTRERFDNAIGNGNLGDRNTEPKARVSYAAAYPDAIGRTVATADYGTNGGEAWGRLQTVPGRSDTILVSTRTYDTVGNLTHQTDPAAITNSRAFDDAGRLITLVENSTGSIRNRRTTRYEYTDGSGLKKLISQNRNTGTQITEWLRGVTTGQGSAINSNRLVFQKVYPGGGSDRVTYVYNRQSQPIRFTDQAGTRHSYTYDKLGRLLMDSVSFPRFSNLDRTVGALTTGYNERGLVIRSTSRTNALGSVVNEVKSAYNDFNKLITEWQEHNGTVNTSTSLKVQYAYENAAANSIRPTTITSPSNTAITTAYASEQANAVSRPDQVKEGSTILASMKFLGLGTLVELDYQAAANARLTMTNGTPGDAGDIYTGLDRFGRLAETLWKTNSTTLIQSKYGRNRVGGVVWQHNVKAHASSAATQDHYYWYDGLQQVTRHDRGNLEPSFGPPYTGIASATRQQQERFTFDETGNWTSENTQNPALAQTRTHNPANQITNISGPSGAVQPAYDPAGNMTVMPSTQGWSVGDELTWDAWNRLTRVRPASSSSSSSSLSSSESSSSSSQSSSSSESSSSSSSESHSSSGSSSSSAPSGEITYQYDARTRRTRKTNTAGSIDYYYDRQWRAIEERVGSSVSAEYVWSPLDRWTMIRRKRGTEVRFVLKDYLDPSAIIDSSANVIERLGYDAFGPVRFMDASFAPRTSSAADWNFLFHAEFLDKDSGLYNYGYRYYNPQLGRWPSRDPIGEKGGLNLYAFVGNDGLNHADDRGLIQIVPGAPHIDKFWKRLNIGGGAVLGTIETAIQLYICCKGKAGSEGYIRTPLTSVASIIGLGNIFAPGECNGPVIIVLYARKYGDSWYDCELEYRAVCLGQQVKDGA